VSVIMLSVVVPKKSVYECTTKCAHAAEWAVLNRF
jgi:hypothetical protein